MIQVSDDGNIVHGSCQAKRIQKCIA